MPAAFLPISKLRRQILSKMRHIYSKIEHLTSKVDSHGLMTTIFMMLMVMKWTYNIVDSIGCSVADISKEVFK